MQARPSTLTFLYLMRVHISFVLASAFHCMGNLILDAGQQVDHDLVMSEMQTYNNTELVGVICREAKGCTQDSLGNVLRTQHMLSSDVP